MTSEKNESGDIKPDASMSGVKKLEFLDESKCNEPVSENCAIESVSVAVQSEKRDWSGGRKVYRSSGNSEISRSGIVVVDSVTSICGTSREKSIGSCEKGIVSLRRDCVKRKRPSA